MTDMTPSTTQGRGTSSENIHPANSEGGEGAPIPYLEAVLDRVRRLARTQAEALRRSAALVADAIAAGGFAHVFGAGHSHMALEEAFPRNGGLVGLHPLTELALSYYTPVVGNSGADQMRFYQSVSGLGEVIWENYLFKTTDCFVVFTNTGLTKVALDIALLAKRDGHPVIGVTSLEHATATGTEHPSGKRLHEIADVVIDNCSPTGDALVEIPGVQQRCGAASTVTTTCVINAIATEAARELSQRGVKPWILASPYFEGSDDQVVRRRREAQEHWAACMKEYRRRYRDLFAA